MVIKDRDITAFLATILIHILFFAPFLLLKKKEEPVQERPKVLNLSQFETPKKPEYTEPLPPIPRQAQKQKPTKQPIKPAPIKQEIPKKDINITKATLPSPVSTPSLAPVPENKKSSALSALNEAFKSSPKSEPSGQIKRLYGDEFESMSTAQQEFIKENLSGIGRITEKHLRYPDVAGRLGMQGQSVVEFWLHPNGDISEPKLLDSSGYKVLDKNSIETIEIAYKDYPRPRQKTKIRIYVRYSIY
jgi:periplasmic protein TonB